MGLFSSKKTYVSSTIYNMAGDIADRSNYLKTIMASHNIGATSGSISQSIQQSYINGPGQKLKSYAKWAKDNYGLIGVPTGQLYSQTDISSEAVTPFIPHAPEESVNVQRVDLRLADFSFWAEQWMLAHEPENINTAWVSNYDDATGRVNIGFADGRSVSFVPDNFDKSAAYIYVLYTTVTGRELDPVVQGKLVTLAQGGSFPSTVGWTQVTNSNVATDVPLNKHIKKTVNYSDGRPDEVTETDTPSTGSYNKYRGVYNKLDYKGTVGAPGELDQLYSVQSTLNMFIDGTVTENKTTQRTDDELEDGKLIRRTTTETTEQVLNVVRTYRVDTQDISSETRSPAKLYIYKLGSGNADLDNLVKQKSDDGFYFPYIPVRLDNKFLSDSYESASYDLAKKAYKKATTGKLDDVIDSLKDNKSLKDIDYAYVMFGISLNTREMTGKKYLFRFFDKLRLTQETGTSDFDQWDNEQNAYDSAGSDWINWKIAQGNPSDPQFGTTAPSVPRSSAAPTSEVRIRSSGTLNTNLDMQITWQAIRKTSGTGLRKPDAKKGDYWIEYVGRNNYSAPVYSGSTSIPTNGVVVDNVAIHYQETENSWQTINITGLTHKNYIYKGKFVEISAKDALADNEESGFLVPLHYDTFQELGIVDSTQLSTACCYLVLNSYLVKKTGFFASTFFKILLVVAVIAITYATGGLGAGSIGLLGANAAVGAAIGLTGTLAIIAGAVANALVAMVLTKLITVGATALFGEKFGAIIGAIASVVALQVGTAMQSGTSLAASIGTLARADNIIQLTNAVGGGVSQYIQAGAAGTMQKTAQLQKDYEKESKELADKYERDIGYDKAFIDPLSLTNSNQFVVEGLSTFLERTLMIGSDVADMSTRLLYGFTDITLSTELPL